MAAYPRASTNRTQYEKVIHSVPAWRLAAQSSSAPRLAPIIRFSVFSEKVKKVLLPVHSEVRTLDPIMAGQSSAGAARRTAGRSTPTRDSWVTVRTPSLTGFRAYHGPASPRKLRDALA